jgi:hypothetical protein
MSGDRIGQGGNDEADQRLGTSIDVLDGIAVRILNVVFRQVGLGLRRGEFVEFPFGNLKAEKRVGHDLSEEGERLLQGENLSSRDAASRRVWASGIFCSSSG